VRLLVAARDIEHARLVDSPDGIKGDTIAG